MTHPVERSIVCYLMFSCARCFMQDRQFLALAKKVDELIELCSELDRENRDLKREAGSWQQERQNLIDRSELAKAKVEAMIGKLKTLEHET